MKKDIFIPILLFAAFIVAVYFLFPQYSKYISSKQDIAALEKQIENRENRAVSAQETLNRLGKYKVSLEKVNSAFPAEISVANLLNILQEAAKKSGLSLENFKQNLALQKEKEKDKKNNGETKKERVKKHYFNAGLKGTFPAFYSFIKEIESSARLIEIEKVFIEKPGDKTFLNINILFSVYSFVK